MMLSDMVDSVIVLNDEHYKRNEFSQTLYRSEIKTDQKFKCKSKKRAACPKRFILNKIVAF